MRVALLLSLLTLSSWAQGIVKLDKIEIESRTYTAVSIAMEGPIMAKITHDSGVKRISAASLSPEIRQQIGYNPDTASAAVAAQEKLLVENQKAQAEAQKSAALVAKSTVKKFWISSNEENGLIVGDFVESSRYSPNSSTGSAGLGGGGGGTYYVPERGDTFYFIPHTKATRHLTNDSEFKARVVKAGTQRTGAGEVIAKYQLLEIIPGNR